MPAFVIPRKPIPVVNEPYWVKFHAPFRGESPATPDAVTPNVRINRRLLRGLDLTMHDGRKVRFWTIGSDNFPGGRFPGETVRVRRGQVVHANVKTSTGTHTIHWHGIEPTPMNDGVGHPSMELGEYTYQWQPNFVGTYFIHCHKNTVLHFEAGLYSLMIIDPPAGPGTTQAHIPGFPGFDDGTHTVSYDVEAAWVVDDIDHRWHNLNATAFEAAGGVDGPFTSDGIFNDFRPRYFFVTGYQVPAPWRGSGSVAPGTTIGSLTPGEIGDDANVQIAVRAQRNQTVLVRTLCAAYCWTRFTFNGIGCKVIAHDGRALGLPPYGYNEAYDVPPGGSFELSTAERNDLLIRSSVAGSFSATVEYFSPFTGVKEFTATIPIVIT